MTSFICFPKEGVERSHRPDVYRGKTGVVCVPGQGKTTVTRQLQNQGKTVDLLVLPPMAPLWYAGRYTIWAEQ